MSSWQEIAAEPTLSWKDQSELRNKSSERTRNKSYINSSLTSPRGRGIKREMKEEDKRNFWEGSLESDSEKEVLKKRIEEMEVKEWTLLERVERLEERMSEERSVLERRTCLGTQVSKTQRLGSPKTCFKPENSFESIEKTLTWLFNLSKLFLEDQLISQSESGETSLKAALLISTQSSPVSTLLDLCQRALDGWDHSRSKVNPLRLQRKLKQLPSGSPPGMKPSKQPGLPSPIEGQSYESMEEKPGECLTVSPYPVTLRCLPMMRLSEEASVEENLYHSLTPLPSDISSLPTYSSLELRSRGQDRPKERKETNQYVVGSMRRGVPFEIADSTMCVGSVEKQIIDNGVS
jgi:hypothetical protein